MSAPSAAVTAKALRLIEQHRVHFELPGGEVLATVEGDSGRYEVGWNGRWWWCSCDNPKGSCSHIIACQLVVRCFGIKIK